MTEVNDDILQAIPDEDLPKLAGMYEKHKNWAPNTYSIITTAIDWNKKNKEKYMTIYSPNNCWKEDGTFFAIVQRYCFNVYIFTLDKTCTNVYKGLTETKKLKDISESCLFICIYEFLYPTMKKAIEDIKLTSENYPLWEYMFTIPREEALEYVIDCPPDVYIKELNETHASVVNKPWPHKFKGSENFISMLIKMNGAFGVFSRSNDGLVAWVLLSIMGQLAILHTKEEHRKKGYASLIIKHTSKELAKRGHNPFAAVLVKNSASIRTFKKLGFRIIGYANYMFIKSVK